jgi:hypothetical protein
LPKIVKTAPFSSNDWSEETRQIYVILECPRPRGALEALGEIGVHLQLQPSSTDFKDDYAHAIAQRGLLAVGSPTISSVRWRLLYSAIIMRCAQVAGVHAAIGCKERSAATIPPRMKCSAGCKNPINSAETLLSSGSISLD